MCVCAHRSSSADAISYTRYAISRHSQVAWRVMVSKLKSWNSLPRRRSCRPLERQVDFSTVEVPFGRLLGQLGKEITLARACARPLGLRATPVGLRARHGAADRDRLRGGRSRPL